MKFETEGMKMLAGVVEVGGEDGVGEGLLRDVGDPVGAVTDDLRARREP